MARPIKFTRYTKGANEQIIVAKALAITVQASYAAFVAGAALGEIGVFYGDTNLLVNIALVAGKTYFIAQKRTNGTYRSPIYTFTGSTFLRTAYVAPVRCTGSLGWNGVSGAMNLIAAPAVTKQYEFGLIETTEGNDPFPSWNYNYTAKPGDVEMDVVQGLVTLVNNLTNPIYKTNTPLVSAKAKAVATLGNYTMTGTTPTITFTNGNDTAILGGTTPTIDMAVGDFFSIDAAATPTNAIGDVYKVKGVVAGVSVQLTRPYQGATQTFVQAEAQGTRIKKATAITATGIVFTDLNDNEHFRITARSEFLYADINNLLTFTRGNGTYLQIQELEAEGLLMQGNTARNTQFGDAAFGAPDTFVVSPAETYDLFNFNCTMAANLSNSFESGTHKATVMLAAPKSAGGLSASLNTIFGT